MIRTFYVSHADVDRADAAPQLDHPAAEHRRSAGDHQFNKTANTITVRASTTVMEIIERVIEQNDKPRAEIVFDVEILEVDRERAKTYGLNLSDSRSAVFSRRRSRRARRRRTTTGTGTGTGTGTTTTTTGTSTPPSGVKSPPPFNLNTISRGFSTADFYLAVPTAVVRFLESDTQTKLLAKPQLRGAEGAKLTLNLGDEIPIVSTSYTPIATGGVGVNPLNSFQLKPVGINIDITPRVTLDGDILIELNVESSSHGAGRERRRHELSVVRARARSARGCACATANRTCWPACCARTSASRCSGFPGRDSRAGPEAGVLDQRAARSSQTDIVMLLTPHIVRTNEITEDDLRPIYIGSQQNLGLGGPPPLIAGLPRPTAPARAGRRRRRRSAAVARHGARARRRIRRRRRPAPRWRRRPARRRFRAWWSCRSSRNRRRRSPAARRGQPPQPRRRRRHPTRRRRSAAAPPPAAPADAAGAGTEPTTPPGVGTAQVLISPPGTTFRVGAGPYTVPMSIVNVSRLSTITLTLTFDPALLRVRAVQEGSFMRSGGANATFTQQVGSGPRRHHHYARRRRDRRVRHRPAAARSSSTPSRPAAQR